MNKTAVVKRKSFLNAGMNRLAVALTATAALWAAGTEKLHAQTTNTGVQDIVDAIDGLKPDVTTIVKAGIGLGIIVLGAMIAWKVAKKFFG